MVDCEQSLFTKISGIKHRSSTFPTCTRSHFLSRLLKQIKGLLIIQNSRVIPRWFTVSMIYVIQKEVEEQVKNAKSIFEFSAKDIQGNDVSLEKYR